MVTWLTMALVLGQASEVVSQVERDSPRLHGAVGVVGTLGVGGFVGGGGPGATAEIGLTLRDRTTVSLRAAFGTIMYTASGSLGLVVDWAASDRWSLGTGVAAGYMGGFLVTDMANAFTVQVPLRAQFAFTERSPAQVSRRGFKLFLEVAPGFILVGSRGYVPNSTEPIPRWAVMGGLGALYAF